MASGKALVAKAEYSSVFGTAAEVKGRPPSAAAALASFLAPPTESGVSLLSLYISLFLFFFLPLFS